MLLVAHLNILHQNSGYRGLLENSHHHQSCLALRWKPSLMPWAASVLPCTELQPWDNHQHPQFSHGLHLMLQLQTWQPLNVCHQIEFSLAGNTFFWMASIILKASKSCANKNIYTLLATSFHLFVSLFLFYLTTCNGSNWDSTFTACTLPVTDAKLKWSDTH